MTTVEALDGVLDTLADYESDTAPVISLYLDLRPDQRQQTVRNKKGKRVSAGGWSQARYQRRLENLHQKHMKEVADAVEQVVKEEQVRRVLVAADDVSMPLLREALSPQTRELLTE